MEELEAGLESGIEDGEICLEEFLEEEDGLLDEEDEEETAGEEDEEDAICSFPFSLDDPLSGTDSKSGSSSQEPPPGEEELGLLLEDSSGGPTWMDSPEKTAFAKRRGFLAELFCIAPPCTGKTV